MTDHPDPAIINGRPYEVILWGCECALCEDAVTCGGPFCLLCGEHASPLYRLNPMSGGKQ